MIRLQHLYKNYTTHKADILALQDINLQVLQGEIFGIVGKSGAGKSTLIRCVNLLEKPSQGSVIVNNQDLLTLSPEQLRKARRKIGMIFQHFNLLNTRTVFENVTLPLEISNVDKREYKDIVLPLLELTGLSDKRNAYPSQLSGGQKQRVAIARALASKPRVLLCDEATSALDHETTHSILNLIKSIRDKLNLAILLITHEMSVIKACCDRVGILDNGSLIEDNDVGSFFAYPKTSIAKNFIYTSMSQKLPLTIEEHLVQEPRSDTHPIVRLFFLPDSATQPIISFLIREFGLSVNILQGNIEYIKNHAMGILLIAVEGDATKMKAGLHHLEKLGVKVEIIGHVPSNIISFN